MKLRYIIFASAAVCILCAALGNKEEKVIIDQWYWNDTIHHQNIPCDSFHESNNYYWVYYNDGKKDSIRSCWLTTRGK